MKTWLIFITILLLLADPAASASPDDLAKVMKGSDCTKCDLSGITIPPLKNLRGIDLSGSNLSGSALKQVLLYKANLSNTNLSGADLTGADLSYAILIGATLCNTTMPNGQVIYSGC